MSGIGGKMYRKERRDVECERGNEGDANGR